mgnify:CR=1 FL=1
MHLYEKANICSKVKKSISLNTQAFVETKKDKINVKKVNKQKFRNRKTIINRKIEMKMEKKKEKEKEKKKESKKQKGKRKKEKQKEKQEKQKQKKK